MSTPSPAPPSVPAGSSSVDASGGRFSTIGYCAAFVALGLASAALGPTLPGLAAHTQSRAAEISVLFVARSSGYLAGSMLGGRLYDRTRGHPVMAFSLLLMAGTLGLAPLLSHLWLLFSTILILGLAEGALDVGGNTLLVWVHRDRVGPFMNALHFFFGLGAFLSPLIIAWAMRGGGDIVRAYWTLALLQVPATLWLLPLASPAHASPAAGSPDGRVSGRVVALIVLFFFLYTGAEVACGGWLYSYAVALRLSGDAVAAYLTSVFWGALTVGRLLAIPLARRFPPHSLLLADCLGCLVSLLVLLLGSQSVAVTFLATCGVGLCMASIFPSALALAQTRVRITGRMTGWFFVGASAGGMTLPWVIGQFFESVGPRITVLILLIDMLAASAVLALLTLQSARPFYHRIVGEAG